jgi:hypothetical protein
MYIIVSPCWWNYSVFTQILYFVWCSLFNDIAMHNFVCLLIEKKTIHLQNVFWSLFPFNSFYYLHCSPYKLSSFMNTNMLTFMNTNMLTFMNTNMLTFMNTNMLTFMNTNMLTFMNINMLTFMSPFHMLWSSGNYYHIMICKLH